VGVVYAVEGGFGREASRDAGWALIAGTVTASSVASVSPVATSATVVAVSTVVAVAVASVLRGVAGSLGCRVCGGDGSGVVRDGCRSGCAVDVEGVVVLGVAGFIGGVAWLGVGAGELRGLVALTGPTATTTATATTPAAAAVGSGCAFAKVSAVGPLGGDVVWGSVGGPAEIGADGFGIIYIIVEGRGAGGEGLAVAVAAASTVATATASAITATVTAVATVTPLGGAAAGVVCGADGHAFGESFAVATAGFATAFAVRGAVAVTAGVEVGGVAGFFHEVGDVEEGVALETDVHKGGLHAREDAGDFAVIDGTGEGVFVLALVVDLGQAFVFDDGETSLVRSTGDVNFFRHCSALSARPG
jgi:hypothetical protein